MIKDLKVPDNATAFVLSSIAPTFTVAPFWSTVIESCKLICKEPTDPYTETTLSEIEKSTPAGISISLFAILDIIYLTWIKIRNTVFHHHVLVL